MSLKSQRSEPEEPEEKGIIAWMARRPVAANLLMILLICGGIWTAFNIQKEVFPAFELDIVNVRVSYPGASPEEVEQGVLRPVEDAIRSVQGIKEFTSNAREGSGSISIELIEGVDRMKSFQDIDQAVSRIRTFPDEIERPEVVLVAPQRDVMEITLYGSVDIWSLRQMGEQLRDRLLADPSITQVELGRIPDYVTHIEISQERLREYGLTLRDIANIIRQSSEDVPAGAVETNSGEILIRLKERRQWADEFGEIEIITSQTGSTVRLRDIAMVTDGFDDYGFHPQFNQQPSIDLEIFRVGEQSPLEIADRVDVIMAEFERGLPSGVNWRIDSNRAKDFEQRLFLLIENGLMAIVIVLLILAAFLEPRLAFWVMMGMTISFVGGIMFMPMADVSINMISMFGFLVVLGIVVDDAIVVGENIHEWRQQGMDPLKAAIKGTKEIATPVTFSIITTVVAFVPLLFIPGVMGKFWWPLPVVVIIVLLVSLFEALFILPSHLAHERKRKRRGKWGQTFHEFQQGFAHRFNHFVDYRYRKFLDLCLKNRYTTVFASVGLFLVVGGYALSGHMAMIMMPEVEADEIEAGIRLPVGTTQEQAAAVAEAVTISTMRMFEAQGLESVAEGVKTNVRGDNFIDVELVMRPPEEHNTTAKEVIELWRDQIGDIPGVDQITFQAEGGPGGWHRDISVDLSHSDIEILELASQAFRERLRTFGATRDVSDNFNRGKMQYDVVLLPEGRLLGLTPAMVGQQIRDAFYGAVAFRQLRGVNEIEVRVKLPEADREDIRTFNEFILRTPSGVEVPMVDVVEVREGEAYSGINRRNGRRIINVSATVEPKSEIGNVLSVVESEVLPELALDYPGITWSYRGSQSEMRKSTAALWGGFAIALAVMYGLLAVAFNSYVQPLIIMLAIPFGIIGAVMGHIVLGFDLSLISVMGVIALSGVVVNDSLIMIDFANKKRKSHKPYEAVLMAGLRRFRPIFLTTITTFGGLTPIILETSRQATYLIPMAISLGFGIVFATAIILVLVPCLYLIVEDFKERAQEAKEKLEEVVEG